MKLRPRRKRSWFPKILEEGIRDMNPFPLPVLRDGKQEKEKKLRMLFYGQINYPVKPRRANDASSLRVTGRRTFLQERDTKITGIIRIIILS